MTHPLVEHFASATDDFVARTRALVEMESPSGDAAALERIAADVAARFAAIGCAVSRHGEGHVEARFDGEAPGPHGLVLLHLDTVWPIGTVASRPVRLDDGRLYGPGAFDMKASAAMIELVLRGMTARGRRPARPVTILFTLDEEVGSRTSRELIESRARGAAYALVLEAPLAGGALKIARKGVGTFDVDIEGRSAHAGVEPEKGVSALLELAHQTLRLHALNDPASGTTVNIGTAHGGTRRNVVAGSAHAEVDLRVWTAAEAERIETAMRGLSPVLPGARVRISGGMNRPPMEPTPASEALRARAERVASEQGSRLAFGRTGGGSDGNFTAGVGAATLDGLGVAGDGAHAEHEHIEVAAFPARAALLTGLLESL